MIVNHKSKGMAHASANSKAKQKGEGKPNSQNLLPDRSKAGSRVAVGGGLGRFNRDSGVAGKGTPGSDKKEVRQSFVENLIGCFGILKLKLTEGSSLW
nr:hypothetical protein Iba_chr04aCG18460 [Ipomoea batatas]